jgi:hypothetical protein
MDPLKGVFPCSQLVRGPNAVLRCGAASLSTVAHGGKLLLAETPLCEQEYDLAGKARFSQKQQTIE